MIGVFAFFMVLIGFVISEAVILAQAPLVGALVLLVLLVALTWRMNGHAEWIFGTLIGLCFGVSVVACLCLLGFGFWAIAAIAVYHILLAGAVWYMTRVPAN